MKIALYGNRHQDGNENAITRLLDMLATRGVAIGIAEKFYNYLSALLPRLPECEVIRSNDFSADVALSIGGDGTFLRTAAWVGNKEIPIVGINTGHLGYLADVPIDCADTIVEEILQGKYTIEDRSLIEVVSNTEIDLPNRFALNEVAILKSASASMLRMVTEVDSRPLTAYLGDGLVVATPTGSTAYNLSAGGPILHPGCHNWVLSPIAPHSLTMRPLVLPDSSEIAIATESGRADTFRLSIDGQSVTLPIGTTITLRKAPYSVRVIQQPLHDFATTLRAKLMWGTDPR